MKKIYWMLIKKNLVYGFESIHFNTPPIPS